MASTEELEKEYRQYALSLIEIIRKNYSNDISENKELKGEEYGTHTNFRSCEEAQHTNSNAVKHGAA